PVRDVRLSRGDRRSTGRRRNAGAAAGRAPLPTLTRPAASRWRRPAIIGAGLLLVLLGIPGIVLPILPGWLLIAIGLIVLSRQVKSARRLVEWLRRRSPSLDRGLVATEGRFQQILSRFSRRS